MRKSVHFLVVISIVSIIAIGCDGDCDNNPVLELGSSVVLLTDYSAGSDFVVRMTGTVLHAHPDASVEFIPTKAFNIREAGYILYTISDIYPEGTIFVCIVEPGTNSPRMVFESDGHAKFLIPDNGLGTRVLNSAEVDTIYSVSNPNVLGGSNSDDLSTGEFYTRALLSLLDEIPLSDFGDQLSDPVLLNIQEPERIGETVKGEVLFTDNFGNCITNIPDSMLIQVNSGDILRVTTDSDSFLITMGEEYSSVSMHHNVALINNSDRLQLSVNYQSMSDRYNLKAGSVISVKPGVACVGILQLSNVTSQFADTAIAQLANLGLIEGETMEFISRNSNGDISLLPGLASSLTEEGVDVILTFATPPSQAAVMNVPEDIPIVFSAVTDPESAGLFNHRGNVTGLSDQVNYVQFIEFALRLYPDLDTAGILYNDQEANSNYVVERLTAIGNMYEISLVTAATNAIDEIPASYQQFSGRDIDVFLTSGDNIISGGMSTLVNLALTDNLAVIGSDVSNAENGALATISIDYDLMARTTGDIVADVLFGISPDDIQILSFDTDVIALNTSTANQIGYVFSNTLTNEARYIFP